MSCKVRARRGILVYRLRFDGHESQEGTRLTDTPKNREKVEARAKVMSHEIEAGEFNYLKWFPDGNIAPRFQTAKPAPVAAPRTIADWLCAYFRRKHSDSYPLVYTLFHTGLRTGEVVGLRWGAVDLRAGTLTVRISRSRGEDNPPKTKNSQRTITLQPDVVALLRAAQPLHVTPESFVFTTPTGLPLDTDRFVELRWHRALRATSTRPRKFYATRHTFISIALSRGCKAKWVAKYCGTSLEMLDKHYGRWMDDDRGQLELLTARAPNAGRRGPKPGPKRIAAASTRSGKRRGEIRTSRGRGAGRTLFSRLAVFHDHALRLVALVLAVVCHQTNGPALNTMLAMARTPIASSNRATISVSETGNGLSA